jgi:hypothetical protein
LDVIPFANARTREDWLPALEKGANGWKWSQTLGSPQFVQGLKNSVIKKPSLLAFVRRHLPTGALNLLKQCLIRRMENLRGSGLNEIQAVFQVDDRANNRRVSYAVGLSSGRVSRPSQGKVWIVLPKKHSGAQPVVTLTA